MQKILVTGGAGYIGSHLVLMLSQLGYDVITYDDLSSGFAEAILGGRLIIGNLADVEKLESLFAQELFDAVIHLAAVSQVHQSMSMPDLYYNINVVGSINLLDCIKKYKIKSFIFSSTAAVYGLPLYLPMDTQHPCSPLSPYGKSKYLIEQIIEDYAKAYGFHYAILRYFNAAGAHPKALIGENHSPETHLIPLILMAAAGQIDHFTLYGRDYDTPDGTCIRDYIHVHDLCHAHLAALKRVQINKTNGYYNLGCGQGYSVQEVINVAQKITGKSIKIVETQRRLGDPSKLVADIKTSLFELNWKPDLSNLESIIQHSWAWILKKNALVEHQS